MAPGFVAQFFAMSAADRASSPTASNRPTFTPTMMERAMLNAICVSSNGSGTALDVRTSRSMMVSAITPSRMFAVSLLLSCVR